MGMKLPFVHREKLLPNFHTDLGEFGRVLFQGMGPDCKLS